MNNIDLNAYNKVRENCGYKILTDRKIIKVTGKDAASYIQTQTSNDTMIIETGKGIHNTLLDRKAHLKAWFTMHRIEETFYLLTEENQSEALQEHLDSFHFTEDFEMEDISAAYNFVLVQGPFSGLNLEKVLNTGNLDIMTENDIVSAGNFLVVSKSETGEKGFLLILPENETETFIRKLETLSIEKISDATYQVLRIEAGLPKYGIDMNETNLMPETGLEKIAVSYSKGCYLGQEVVARIKTYGIVAKALIGLVFEGNETPPFNSEIIIDGKNTGTVKSTTFSPALGKPVAFAYLQRDYRKPDETIEFESQDKKYTALLKMLPFYHPEQEALKLYEKALDLFAQNNETEAIRLLRIASSKNPQHKDSYETLGVILSRLGKHQEAIEVMNKLTEIAPDEPMARTNLSIFYMRLGNKDEAEAQMAKANELKFKKTIEEGKQKKQLEERKQQELEAIKERMEMFREVLETEDPDDLIANFGLGKSLFDLKQASEAIPYLQKAIKIKKDYSMAFLILGKAFEETGNKEEAKNTYRQGITVASQKGDLMPLKEMEMRKYNLENK